MKKIALAATIAALAAMPALADTATKSNDPFVSTQGGLGGGAGMAAIGITAVGIIVAASDGT